MVLHSTLFLDLRKQSAKSITKHAQRHLTHTLYKETLLSGNVLRSTNTRIASNHHKLFTVVVNKISLSPFYNKRYIGEDKICSLPFGHWSLRDEMFAREILQNPDWGESDQEESSPHAVEISPTFEPPDMGFFQRHYSQSELESDLVDFDHLSDVSEQIEYNPFILHEAEESSADECVKAKRRRAYILESSDDD